MGAVRGRVDQDLELGDSLSVVSTFSPAADDDPPPTPLPPPPLPPPPPSDVCGPPVDSGYSQFFPHFLFFMARTPPHL